MAKRISVKRFKEELGIDEEAFLEYLQECVDNGISPAMCEDGCEVEPDGTCEHGHPSLLIVLGII